MSDPFTTLGLTEGASADDVRGARRDLARSLHPDAGGDAVAMQQVNAAAADALRILASRAAGDERNASTHAGATSAAGSTSTASSATSEAEWTGVRRDVPSFTIEALPAEAFEALLVATAELGEVEDDDPPYELRTLLSDPIVCWCQLDVVPDAGASTVSVSIAPVEGHPLPSLIDVRNAWIIALNGLDWSAL